MAISAEALTTGVEIGNTTRMAQKRNKGAELSGAHIEFQDDYSLKDKVVISPLKSTAVLIEKTETGIPREKSYDNQLQAEMNYLSATKSLEIDSERSKILSKLASDMASGEKTVSGKTIQTRVIIMQRGTEPEAFVMPDGTIFISQSALKICSNLDEIAAILAHEVQHLINETFENKARAEKLLTKLSVGHLHEMVADRGAERLMEKIGFNTTAFSSIIDRISGHGRDIFHQTGQSRGAVSIAHHGVRESTTSAKELTPKPLILDGKVEETNIDLINKAIDGFNLKQIEDLSPKLHPNDLIAAYKKIDSYYDLHKSENQIKQRKHLLTQLANNLFSERLANSGYLPSDITAFLLALGSQNIYLFPNPEDVVEAASSVAKFGANGLAKIHDILFYQDYKGDFDMVTSFFNKISEYYHDLSQGPLKKTSIGQKKLPVTWDSLIDAYGYIRKAESSHQSYISYHMNQRIYAYIAKNFLRDASGYGLTVDKDQLIAYFQTAKEAGLPLEAQWLEATVGQIWDAEDFNQNTYKQKLYQNWMIAAQAFQEVFGVGIHGKYETIKPTSQEMINLFTSSLPEKVVMNSLLKFEKYFSQETISDEERLEFLSELGKNIDQLSPNIDELDNKIFRFQLKMATALITFPQASPSFYAHLTEIMDQSGLELGSLSAQQLTTLLENIFQRDNVEKGLEAPEIRFPLTSGAITYPLMKNRGIMIQNYDSLIKLPFVKALIEKTSESPHLSTLKEFNDYMTVNNFEGNIFSDKLQTILVSTGLRRNLLSLIEQGVTEEEFGELEKAVDMAYPDGPQKDQFKREFSYRYLRSGKVSLDDKMDYYLARADSIGPEGAFIIADQIYDLDTYIRCRERSQSRFEEALAGSEKLGKLAAAEFVTSFVTSQFDILLQSSRTDESSKVKYSTGLARRWSESYFLRPDNVHFNHESGKIDVAGGSREKFISFSDVVDRLKGLTPFQRTLIAFKALTDTKGGLSSADSRGILARSLVGALDLPSGFLQSVLIAAIKTGEARLIGFPAAKILAPLMFRALDPDDVDIRKLGKEGQMGVETKILGEQGYKMNIDLVPLYNHFSEAEVKKILHSTTRDIVRFGAKFQHGPDSPATRLAAESEAQYYKVTDMLNNLLIPQEKEAETGVKSEVPNSIEAIISGAESSALGIKLCQLSTQFIRFPENIQRRLNRTQDNNPGQRKLVFLENLFKLSQAAPLDIQENGEYEAAGQFLRDNKDRLKILGMAGGGSLFTTYFATLTQEDGSLRDVVIKMRNPNALFFVTETAKLARDVLEKIRKDQKSRQVKAQAETAEFLVDLAERWCKSELTDKTFMEDDAVFRQSISEYNRRHPDDLPFQAPSVVFNSFPLKLEEAAGTHTFNRLLSSETLSQDEKKKLVTALGKFFKHQLTVQVPPDGGERVYVVHSDPQTGNIMISKDGKNGQVIDRGMYLKFTEEEMKTFQLLLTGADNTKFLNSFINIMLNRSKYRNSSSRNAAWRRIWMRVGKEWGKQKLHRQTDNSALLTFALSEMLRMKMEIPLEYELLIRNIGLMQELFKREGLSLEELAA